MPTIPVLDRDAVLGAVTPDAAIDHVREALLRHHAGAWVMPPKVYVDCPPDGDFRAMPARGEGLALLKWITSFPGNPARGLPTVMGIVCLSDASNGCPLMLLDAGSVTALRTGAVAAVAATALAAERARTAGLAGCGLNGSFVARCLVAAGYREGVCFDADTGAAERLAAELGDGWRAGSHADALAADVVSCVTPGAEVVVNAEDLHPGLHLNMLGADAAGKAEASIDAVSACQLFCDEWEQASHGGELTGAVRAGAVAREHVTELGAVLAGTAPGRRDGDAVTMFDSTGLAIQDLAIARAALAAWRDGRVEAETVRL